MSADLHYFRCVRSPIARELYERVLTIVQSLSAVAYAVGEQRHLHADR